VLISGNSIKKSWRREAANKEVCRAFEIGQICPVNTVCFADSFFDSHRQFAIKVCGMN